MQLIHSLRRGGAERIALDLALNFSEHGDAAIIVCITDTNEYRDSDYMGIPTHPLLPAGQYRWPFCLYQLTTGLNDQMARFKPDTLIIHTANAAIVEACSRCEAPILRVFHGHGESCRPPSPKALLHQWLERRTFSRRRSRAVAVSPEMRPAIAKHLSIPLEDILPIPNGIDIRRFPKTATRAQTPPIIYMLGTLSRNKRPDRALRAFHHLQDIRPATQFHFIGDGPERVNLEQATCSRGLAPVVKFLGTRSDIAALLCKGALLWHLSDEEGLPLAVLEAMASGLPVIGADVRGTRDIVLHGKTGFLVDNNDDPAPIVRHSLALLDNPALYRSFSLAARHRVETCFSISDMSARYRSALEELIQPTDGARPSARLAPVRNT